MKIFKQLSISNDHWLCGKGVPIPSRSCEEADIYRRHMRCLQGSKLTGARSTGHRDFGDRCPAGIPDIYPGTGISGQAPRLNRPKNG